MAFREVGKAEALQRGFKEKACTVKDKLALNPDVELPSVLLELPCVETAAMGRQAEVEAVLVGQVVGGLGPLAFGEVGWRADHGHSEVAANSYAYHVFGNQLAGPDAGIDLLG